MPWLTRQAGLLGLFILGALFPLGGILGCGGLGWICWRAAGSGWRLAGYPAAGLLAAAALRALWLAFQSWPLPGGPRIGAEEAPELAAHLRAWQARWRGPEVEGVRLDPRGWGVDLVGTPRGGLLGWCRFTWILSLYPLLALSAREYEAMAAWELVWWSGAQGWLNLQVKRLACHWRALARHLGPQGPGSGWIRWGRPELWYARRLERSFDAFLVEAFLSTDAIVAERFGVATLGRALCRLAILRPQMDGRILPELLERLLEGEPLPGSLHDHLSEALARPGEEASGMLLMALEGLVPEAPSLLSVRLRQLGAEPGVPLPPSAPASRLLLGGSPLLQDLEAALRAQLHLWLHFRTRSRSACPGPAPRDRRS